MAFVNIFLAVFFSFKIKIDYLTPHTSCKCSSHLSLYNLHANKSKLNTLKIPSGQIRSAWEWYHCIRLRKDNNRSFFIFLFWSWIFETSNILLTSCNPKNYCWLSSIFGDRFGGKDCGCAHTTRLPKSRIFRCIFVWSERNYELFQKLKI